jgi:hypothetical protein
MTVIRGWRDGGVDHSDRRLPDRDRVDTVPPDSDLLPAHREYPTGANRQIGTNRAIGTN